MGNYGNFGVFVTFAVLRSKRVILNPGTRDYGMVHFSGKSPKRGSFLANSGEFRVWEVRMCPGGRKKKDLFLRAPRTILRRIIRRMTFTSFMSLLCTSMSTSRHDDLTNSSTMLSHQHHVDSSMRFDVDNFRHVISQLHQRCCHHDISLSHRENQIAAYRNIPTPCSEHFFRSAHSPPEDHLR